MKFRIEFYENVQGRSPVQDFLEDLKDTAPDDFAVILAGLNKLKPCKPCKRKGLKTARSSCATCRQQNAGAYKSAVKKLTALTEKHPDLPITRTVKEKLAGLK